MKLFSWVQNKLNGKQTSNKENIITPRIIKREEKEEFRDWPQAFLSIGTFGNKDLKEEITTKVLHEHNNNNNNNNNNLQISQENLTLEELNALVLEAKEDYDHGDHDHHDDHHDHDDQLKHFATVDASNNKIAISKKSIAFLLKKMLICGSSGMEVGPTPFLRDHSILSPLQTRMEKILRELLNKKVHPQSPSQSTLKKKYLESRQIASTKNHNHDQVAPNSPMVWRLSPKLEVPSSKLRTNLMINKKMNDNDDDCHDDQGNDGSKWVKTDTEYIVLEI